MPRPRPGFAPAVLPSSAEAGCIPLHLPLQINPSLLGFDLGIGLFSASLVFVKQDKLSLVLETPPLLGGVQKYRRSRAGI